MKKNQIYLGRRACFFALIFGMILSSCSKDTTASNFLSSPRGSSGPCDLELNYKVKELKFVRYGGDQNTLTIEEKSQLLPSSYTYDYNICRTGGQFVSKINCTAENASNYGPNTLGLERGVNWHSVNDNGTLTTYDESNNVLEVIPNHSLIDVTKLDSFNTTTLISPLIYNELLLQMGAMFGSTNLSNDLVMFTKTENNIKVESIFSKEFQKEIVTRTYTTNNEIDHVTVYIYEKINNNTKVRLKSEIFEAYKKSIYSDRKMILTEANQYIY